MGIYSKFLNPDNNEELKELERMFEDCICYYPDFNENGELMMKYNDGEKLPETFSINKAYSRSK